MLKEYLCNGEEIGSRKLTSVDIAKDNTPFKGFTPPKSQYLTLQNRHETTVKRRRVTLNIHDRDEVDASTLFRPRMIKKLS